MANYLVTGGAGFIGSNIVDLLVRDGESVRVADDLSTGRMENLDHVRDQIEFVEADLADPDICHRVAQDMEYVIHQAAVPSVPLSVRDPLRSHRANATATLNLLAAARDAGARRFVYAGSSSAYGNQPGESKDETVCPDPLSPYAASKLAGEHYVRVFSECYGMETVTLRYFNVFGPRQDPASPYSAVIPLFIAAMIEGRPVTIDGDGGQSRDFTYVENNARANLLAATAPFKARGQAYNIACGECISVLELARSIEQCLGVKADLRHGPARVGDVRDSRADISRARADLGYEVVVPFSEGLGRTVAWYRDHAGTC
jgi:nucleoside-diphosphate-sugar epimerase